MSLNQATNLRQIAIAHQQSGQLQQAQTIYREILQSDPHDAQALHQLGILAHQMGDNPGAIALIEQSIIADPTASNAHNDLGGLFNTQDEPTKAIACFQKALILDPSNERAHYNLGYTLQQLGQLAEAVVCYRQALAIRPAATDALSNLGACLMKQGAPSEAEACFRQTLQVSPNQAEAHNNLGIALQAQGRLEEASKSFESAVSIKPDFIDSHYTLSMLKTYHAGDPHAAMLEQQINRLDGLSIETRIAYWFALGKVREDLGKYDQSFSAYQEGNRLKCTLLAQIDDADDAWIDHIISIFSKDFFVSRKSSGHADKTPILIVGMPRSGTSLLEQILSTCPGVYGAGELHDLGEIVTAAMQDGASAQFPASVPELPIEAFKRLGEQYLERIRRHAPDAARITDKMPINFVYLGLIHLMLPQAKIIHAMRDPMDSCFSCYSRLFDEHNLGFTYDLEALGHYYVRYTRLMQHWHSVLPAGTILDVRYEDVVADTEGQARRLLEYLDLPWNDRCLEFHQNKRHVATASAAQVRKPIYKSSLARWQRYSAHLAPLWNLVKDHHDLPLPQDPQALHMLGLDCYRMGDDGKAIELIEQALAIKPANINALNDLGGLFSKQGSTDQAAMCFRRALALDASNGRTHYNLGCALQAQGKLEEAEACYRQAHALIPNAIDILCNLGGCLQEQRKPDAAIVCYRQALALSPDDIGSLNNLGVSLQTNGKMKEAITCFERTIALCPDSARTYINLGMTYYDLGEYERALSHYRHANAIDPNYAYAHFCIGVALQALCMPEEAMASYRHSLALSDDNPIAHSNLLMVQLFVPGTSPQDLFDEHKRFGVHVETPLKPHWPRHANLPDPAKRLKIGYVSGDFRRHAVAYFIEPVLANHDKSQFEIFCYSNSARNDDFTDRLIAESDHWQPCLSMSDEQLAQRMLADGIDILIDLSGHTAHNRLLTFARKPAPIQITYLGYPGTSGLSAMDYRLTDHFCEPEGGASGSEADRYYTETLLRLPDSMWCYRPMENMPEITPLPALTNGYVTFGSFNNVNKVGSECIALWAALLRSLPTARLLMVTVPEGELRTRLSHQFMELGVAADRISYCGKLPSHEFQRMLQQVDITLDPLPINGATTSCESLWLGVPVLTLVGKRFLSRAGLSVLSAAQLPDFAAATQEDFTKTATLLANNLPLLASVRAGLREHLRTTPLFDPQRFTRNLEEIYRNVWTQWCRSGN